MNAQEDYFLKIISLCELIEKGSTGNSDEIAQKLNISRRTVFCYLENLRDKGALIAYSRKENTFLFKEEFSVTDTLLKI